MSHSSRCWLHTFVDVQGERNTSISHMSVTAEARLIALPASPPFTFCSFRGRGDSLGHTGRSASSSVSWFQPLAVILGCFFINKGYCQQLCLCQRCQTCGLRAGSGLQTCFFSSLQDCFEKKLHIFNKTNCFCTVHWMLWNVSFANKLLLPEQSKWARVEPLWICVVFPSTLLCLPFANVIAPKCLCKKKVHTECRMFQEHY